MEHQHSHHRLNEQPTLETAHFRVRPKNDLRHGNPATERTRKLARIEQRADLVPAVPFVETSLARPLPTSAATARRAHLVRRKVVKAQGARRPRNITPADTLVQRAEHCRDVLDGLVAQKQGRRGSCTWRRSRDTEEELGTSVGSVQLERAVATEGGVGKLGVGDAEPGSAVLLDEGTSGDIGVFEDHVRASGAGRTDEGRRVGRSVRLRRHDAVGALGALEVRARLALAAVPALRANLRRNTLANAF